MRLKQTLVLLMMTVLLEYSAPGFTVQAAAPAKPGFDEKAVADFYRGKTIRIVVGFSAGGGYDQYSRLDSSAPIQIYSRQSRRHCRQHGGRRQHYRRESHVQRTRRKMGR